MYKSSKSYFPNPNLPSRLIEKLVFLEEIVKKKERKEMYHKKKSILFLFNVSWYEKTWGTMVYD